MNLTSWNFKKIVFQLKTKILQPKIFADHRAAIQTLKTENIAQLNFKRRHELVVHAYANSPFYKEKYKDHHLQLANLTEQDFTNLPVVTRDDLANNFERFVTVDHNIKRYNRVSSSGSTGRPVCVLQDPDYPYTTLQWRILSWWDVKPYENQAFIYRYKRPWFKRLANTILWWPTRRAFFAGSNMNLARAKHFASTINRIKPALLQGYVDVVYEFALFILDNNLKIHSPKMVWVTSAPLLENQRKLMEMAFGAPVCDQYGNTEVFTIAAECPEQRGLHVMHDAVFLEFVDDQHRPVEPGRTGKILITDLRNKLFPIIRYENGDRGRASTSVCPCGIPLPLMESVRGRQSVTLKTPSSLAVRSEHLALIVEQNIKQIREVQLFQRDDYTVEMRYVTNVDTDVSQEVEALLIALKVKTRNEIPIEAKKVDAIEMKGSKKPLIISKLQHNPLGFTG